MAWTLNQKAKEHALKVVQSGRISDEPWDADAAERRLLGDPPDWDRYALWHLAVDRDKSGETKDSYAYPYGDGERVFRRAIAAIKARAAQQGEEAIKAAADEIWDAIQEKEKSAPVSVVKSFNSAIELSADNSRRISVIAATEDRDRVGDIVRISGIDVDNFLRNPVILAGHGAQGDVPVIGKAVDLRKDGGRLLCTVEFLPPGVNELADKVFNVVRFLGSAAASVGLIVKDFKPLPDRGIEITASELLEISIVPVPANPEAVAALKAAGEADHQAIVRTLELAQELVQELAALVTALYEKSAVAERKKRGSIIIRRA